MLRSTRRPARSFVGAFAVVFSIALMWPAAIAAAPVQRTDSAPTSNAPAERTPAVVGQGVSSVADVKAGPKPKLQTLGLDRTDRTATGGRAPVAPQDIQAAPAPVHATISSQPAVTSFGAREGISQAASGFEPPDPWIAVGPDDVVQSVNTLLRFTNREGTSTALDVDVFDFFDLANFELECDNPPCAPVPLEIDGIGDPRWHYDVTRNRWIGIVLGWHCDRDGSGVGDDSLGFIFGAISTADDPTGDYYHFYIQYPGFLPDFPMLGTSKDKFTISANEYSLSDQLTCTSGIPFDGPSLTTFDWAQMAAIPGPALPDFTYDLQYGYFSLRPAVSPQSTSSTIYVVGEQLIESATDSNVAFMRITGTNAGGGTVTSPPIDLTAAGVIAAFRDPPTPVQPGGPLASGIVDRRPTDAVWQDNKLTFASTFPCDPPGGATETRACGRVTQIGTVPATPYRVQDMIVSSSGVDVWFPGIGVSQSGTLHVVYTRSSATEGMSSYDRYQLASDAPYTLSPSLELANGGGTTYTGDRWGDFVGVAQDPRDTNAVWQANQYTRSGGDWGTRVSQLQTAGSTFVPISPVRVLDSRTGNGLSGKFVANVPRTLDVAGRMGIPANAVAITGNLTIVEQTAAGFAALTQTPIVNPLTSTINFPTGDVRANNVTSPLSSLGGVSIVYKAVPNRTTHVILDITGYFLNGQVAASHTYKTMASVRVLDTRTGNGLSGAFNSNQNRTFQVSGRMGIPANAKAITGNLTVTNQTAAGYVTLATDAPPVIPATSTINFPVGDPRANGVTVKLSVSGKLTAVYKAVPGRTTHLVLDVTGYYVNDLSGARFVPLTPGRRMDTRVPAPMEGLSGAFSANFSRTLVIEPYQGVPGNATAITGNLTVVGQSRAGFVSMTQVATSNPATSTLNFPLNDVRANGVTGPLSGSGSVGLVFKATGGTTHLILDLTGYFR